MALTLSRQFVTLTGTGKAVRVFFLLLGGQPLLGQPKNCFTKALPTLRVSGYLVTISVSVYIQIHTHRFASSPYLQLLPSKPYIKEPYQYSGAFL